MVQYFALLRVLIALYCDFASLTMFTNRERMRIVNKKRPNSSSYGMLLGTFSGESRIRTHETISRSSVFKTDAISQLCHLSLVR